MQTKMFPMNARSHAKSRKLMDGVELEGGCVPTSPMGEKQSEK